MKRVLLYAWIFFFLFSCGISKSSKHRPNLQDYNGNRPLVSIHLDTFLTTNANQLRKNRYGLWELYVQGDPLELGLATGALTQKLLQKQERIFFEQIATIVPSKTHQRLLRSFLAWYNRKLYHHIPPEYQVEIYGISRYASDNFAYIPDNYLRMLYLHGAHDIGHALQDLALVGCSSFAAWGDKTKDGNLIVGRNFDFYAGDDFAKDKIIAFVAPEEGYKFMSVTWGGMMGVVSGMNEQGLTVTINAGKSSIPIVAKTPISILTREILQYASTIEEAIAIAKKRTIFVSESILVASAQDKKAVSIELAPKNFGVHTTSTNQLICSNHFQSFAYAFDKKNKKHIAESHSQYRYDRMLELLNQPPKITPQIAVDILRNREGLQNKKIGYGNEKAINQLLAHHAIIFQPEQRLVWVSSAPYQLGEFVAYDLNKVFQKLKTLHFSESLHEKTLLIEKDSFLYTKAYQQYEEFRNLRHYFQEQLKKGERIAPDTLIAFQNSNPDYWETHFILGQYFYQQKNYQAALDAYQTGLTKEITSLPDQEILEKYIKKTNRKLTK